MPWARKNLGTWFPLQERVIIWKFGSEDPIYGENYRDRVNVSPNAEVSDASITIRGLTMTDNGTYECSVSLLSDLYGTSQARVRLLVLGEERVVMLQAPCLPLLPPDGTPVPVNSMS